MFECALHERLIQEKQSAWSAYHELRDSGSEDQQEVHKRYIKACELTTTLRLHVRSCGTCAREHG